MFTNHVHRVHHGVHDRLGLVVEVAAVGFVADAVAAAAVVVGIVAGVVAVVVDNVVAVAVAVLVAGIVGTEHFAADIAGVAVVGAVDIVHRVAKIRNELVNVWTEFADKSENVMNWSSYR